MKKLNVAFLGTPEFSLPTLEELAKHPEVNLISVITMPDRPAGRGQKLTPPPVAEFAKKNNISLFQTENINKEDDFLNDLKSKNVDLLIVLAFAQFLKKKVLDLPKIGCFNIHTSLLPKYRGAAPIQYALLNGDFKTGVSIQKMVPQMDAGDLVYSQEVKINPDDNFEKLSERLKLIAAEAVSKFLNLVLQNQLTYSPQDPSKVTFAPTFQKENGHLYFQEKTDEEIINQIRAFTPWPSAFCFINLKRMKVNLAEKEPAINLKPGQVDITNNQLMVGCRNGTLRLREVQLEGKRPCSDTELLNGIKNKNDSVTIS
jgi:methionyl-tRNA formyltransferase